MGKRISKLTKIQKEIEKIENLILDNNDKLKLLEKNKKEEIVLEKNKLVINLSIDELEKALLLLEIEQEQEQEREREREKEKEKNLEESQDNNVDIIEENNIGGDNFDHNNN